MIADSDILKAKILIADDQEVNVTILYETLRSAGYTGMESTTNPLEIVELHQVTRYDLILLDLKMPEMDGFEVMEALKQVEGEEYLPVLVLTSQPDQQMEALRCGAKDYISKPFELKEVLLRVHNLLETRLLYQFYRDSLRKVQSLNGTLEQKVSDRTIELESANKELQAFSYSVSHDLRAPLRHILGFVSLLQKGAKDSLSGQDLSHLETITEAATKMGDLIDDLLEFSRVGHSALKKTSVNLQQIIEEIIQDSKPDTNSRTIDWKICDLPLVFADRALLRIALTNLVSNGLKFTSRMKVATIEIGTFEKDNEIVVYVRDNGAGFDPRYAHKLFGVFQRLHGQVEFEGTGIGLANVQRIINRHGGKTWAEGAINSGATFYCSLPREGTN